MAWVRIGNDGGACIIVDGVAYGKVTNPVQPTSGAITDTPDVINISEIVFDNDDSNVWHGPNHRTWSACEVGIAKYVPGNQGSVLSQPTWVTLYTAPSAGVVRTYGMGGGDGLNYSIKLNGTILTTTASDRDMGLAYGVGVMSGDVIEVKLGGDRWLYSIFLPNVYP